MWFYIKKAVFPFVYLFFMAVTAFGILCIKVSLLWLKILLSILNLGLYCFIVAGVFYKEGQEAVKIRHANDLERREMVRTGTVRPLKLKEEYKPWKGYFIGFIACIPLIFCLLVHSIIMLAGGTTRTFGVIGGFIYFVVFVFFSLSGKTLAMADYFYALAAVPLLILLSGVFYNLGARKIIIQQRRIREKQAQIYGK